MRNLQKYVDNETYVMPENAHMLKIIIYYERNYDNILP